MFTDGFVSASDIRITGPVRALGCVAIHVCCVVVPHMGLGLACLLAPPVRPVFLCRGVTVLGWYMCSALVGGLLVGACVGVFGWLPLCGAVGLHSGADVTRLCVCV